DPWGQPGLRHRRGTSGTTQDPAGVRGPPGAAGAEREQRDPRDHTGPSRRLPDPGSRGTLWTEEQRGDPREQLGLNESRETPGSSQDRAGAERPPGAEGPPGPALQAGTWGAAVPSRYPRLFLTLWSCRDPGERAGILGTPLTRCPPSMAQWQEVQNLANTYLEQVHQLYAGSALPMAVRQCLAAWIESQNWRQAAEPLSSHAPMLFHSLLVLL
ncbi:STAT3 protein, partial [Hippolais icterina]|nr:STAT3 protein [Hippolais icterina]